MWRPGSLNLVSCKQNDAVDIGLARPTMQRSLGSSGAWQAWGREMRTALDGIGKLWRLGHRFGPYLVLELILPGGTLFAVLLFLYRRRDAAPLAVIAARLDARPIMASVPYASRRVTKARNRRSESARLRADERLAHSQFVQD